MIVVEQGETDHRWKGSLKKDLHENGSPGLLFV